MRRGTAGPATANRTMSLVRSILNAAAGWGWIDRVPVVPMSPEVREEPRYLERDAATAFVAELPEHLQPIAQFGLATGLREQNILRLRWAAVDIEARAAWVSNCETKAAKSLRVPLSSEAVVVLRRQRELVPRACPWVFPSSCAAGLPEYRPFARVVSTAWRNARDRAGVPWLTFHHLRHTWASWHVMAGTPLEVLQRLGGWSSLAMVMRYAHLSESHVDAYADRAGGLRAVQQQSAEATRKRK
jgi:integrase